MWAVEAGIVEAGTVFPAVGHSVAVFVDSFQTGPENTSITKLTNCHKTKYSVRHLQHYMSIIINCSVKVKTPKLQKHSYSDRGRDTAAKVTSYDQSNSWSEQ